MKNLIIIDRKRTNYSGYEYILSELDEFLELLPYMRKKIRGSWYLCFISPSMDTVRSILDLDIKDFIDIDLFIEDDVFVSIANERPSMFPKLKTVWEQYLDLVYDFPKSMNKECVNYLFKRVGRSIPALTEALDTLRINVDGDVVTKNDITKNIPKTSNINVSQIANLFLLGKEYRWQLIDTFSEEYTFYAFRKYLYSLISYKREYLEGGEVKSSICESVDSMLLVRAYELFNNAKSTKELIPILILLDEYRKEREKCL